MKTRNELKKEQKARAKRWEASKAAAAKPLGPVAIFCVHRTAEPASFKVPGAWTEDALRAYYASRGIKA